MIKESYSIHKPEIVKVRLSTPFMVRGRCKHCAGLPSIYYCIRNPAMWFNPRKALGQLDFFKELLKHLTTHYPDTDPKHYTSASHFSYDISNMKYRPRLHRTRGSKAVLDFVEFLACDCMQTTWAYADKATERRPEINQRKARYRFPTKFEF